MLQLAAGKNQLGQDIAAITIQETLEPLPLLRALKQSFPQLWAQVNLEMYVPMPGGVNRILNSEGKPNGDA